MASPEQERILAHPATKHGRILAGPGTGKSTTVLELAERLLAESLNVRVITFTRAATAELTEKALKALVEVRRQYQRRYGLLGSLLVEDVA